MFHTIQKFLKEEKPLIVMTSKAKKQQFLSEHNRLSPLSLQATTSMLSRFKVEKSSLFKDESWPIEKLRRPFILWLTSLTSEEKESINS